MTDSTTLAFSFSLQHHNRLLPARDDINSEDSIKQPISFTHFHISRDNPPNSRNKQKTMWISETSPRFANTIFFPLSETPLQALDGQGSDGGKEIIADDSFVQPSSSLKSPSLSPLPTSTVKKVGDLTTFSPLEEYESTRKMSVSNPKAPLQLRSSCVSTTVEEVTSPNRGARGVQETMLPGLEVTPILITLFFNTASR